jgi:hypothetical protein
MNGHSKHLHHCDILGRLGLPPIPFPLPAELQAADDEFALDYLLYWLQDCSASPGADWQGLEYALQRVLEHLAADRESAANGSGNSRIAESERWWLRLDPVALDRELLTLERQGYMLAAISPSEDMRLQLIAYRPLDAQSLRLITQLAEHPHPRLGVGMRENNWQLALDTAAGQENFLASTQGAAYLAHWPSGLGCAWTDTEQCPLPPVLTALQLDCFRRHAGATAERAVGAI